MNPMGRREEKRCQIVIQEIDEIRRRLRVAKRYALKGNLKACYSALCDATAHLNRARLATFKPVVPRAAETL